MTVLIQDTEKTLAEVADIAASGEEVLLVRDGKTVARVTANPVERKSAASRGERRFGALKKYGFKVPDDIKAPFKKEIDEMFFGDADERI